MFDPVPRFKSIVEHYKEKIISGQLQPGDAMPSVREVARSWECAHATAARALRELQSEGYAYTVGQTTIVADRRSAKLTLRVPVTGTRNKGDVMPPPAARAPGEDREPVGGHVTAAALVEPPAYVPPLFGLDLDSEVVRVEEVVSHGGRPVRLTVRWYPPQYSDIPNILKVGNSAAGGWAGIRYAIELRRGTTLNAGLDSFHARLADQREAGLLRIGVGSPVQARVTTWADREGVAEYIESVYPSDVTVSMEYLDSLSELGDPDSE